MGTSREAVSRARGAHGDGVAYLDVDSARAAMVRASAGVECLVVCVVPQTNSLVTRQLQADDVEDVDAAFAAAQKETAAAGAAAPGTYDLTLSYAEGDTGGCKDQLLDFLRMQYAPLGEGL